jgi:hypothetical protein
VGVSAGDWGLRMSDNDAIRHMIAQIETRFIHDGGKVSYRIHRIASGRYEIIACVNGCEVGRSGFAQSKDADTEIQKAQLRALQSAAEGV